MLLDDFPPNILYIYIYKADQTIAFISKWMVKMWESTQSATKQKKKTNKKIVTSSLSVKAFGGNGVYFVDENDGGRVFFG